MKAGKKHAQVRFVRPSVVTLSFLMVGTKTRSGIRKNSVLLVLWGKFPKGIVAFRSAKGRSFAERKATLQATDAQPS